MVQEAGFGALDLQGAGFNAWELFQAGFDADALKEAGFNAWHLREAGFNAYLGKLEHTCAKRIYGHKSVRLGSPDLSPGRFFMKRTRGI